MIGFTEILNNVGDFARRQWQTGPGTGAPVPMREARNGWSIDPDWTGSSNAYTDDYGRDERRPGLPATAAQFRNRYYRDLREAGVLLKRAFDGNGYARLMLRDAMMGRFREALSISDFPNLFGDIIDRAVLANYRETPYTYNMVANISQVSDFRTVKRFRVDGGTGLLSLTDASGNLVPVEPGAQYPEDKLVDAKYSYNVAKYGKRMPFLWEVIINDDLNALKDTPARFGQGARRTREYFVTKLYANNTTFFSAGNKNKVVPTGPYTATNPPLSITSLAQAMTIMSQQVDTTGSPITVEAMTLVVPPSLKVTAQNILNADYFWANDQGGTTINGTTPGTSGQRLNVANWAKNIVKLAVNYYLPIVDLTYGNQGWYLFSDPNNGRPAMEFGELRGHQEPELFMKLPNSVGIGEGALGPGNPPMVGSNPMNPMEGDFETDSIHYKIRDVFGGVLMDPLMGVYSNGSGS